MRSFAKRFTAAAAAAAVSVALAGPARGQDQQLVEEIVAHVNAEVILKSQYDEAVRDTEQDFKANLPPEEAAKKFAEFKPKVLDLMIDSILLVQKGQELGIDVESRINAQLSEMARQQNMSITDLEESMRRQGVEPNDVRARLRERMMRDAVLNQEVYGQIWRALTERQKREFYDANKDKFIQPGELKLSELFLPVEGRSFGEIETKAREIAAAARSGQPFPELVKKHGDPTRASYANGGSLGSFKSAEELAAPLSTAVGQLKTGDLTDPIRLADGVIVIRVDERREPAPKPFDEVKNDVSLAMVYERSREEEMKYLKKLRDEAYIRINAGYVVASVPQPAAEKQNP